MADKETPRNYRKEPPLTTTIRRLQTTFSGIRKWRSLQTRMTIFTLTFVLVGIWSLALYASYRLKTDMARSLGEQQFSTVSIIAAEINAGLDDRIEALGNVATRITPAMMGNAASMQKFLEGHAVLPMMFNGGFFVLLPDGTAIADYPLSTGRRGLNFMDRKYAIGALKEGKTTIGRPVMGKALRSTIFSIATPIHDTKGKVIGALAGTIDLAKPNFLSRITDNRYGKTGGYLVVSPNIRTIVFATDKKRIMEVLPASGINPLVDRFIQGYEGSGITIRPSDGVATLSSAKGIPVSGWYVVALIPTEEAFAPIRAMQQRMLLAAIFLTLLASGLTWLMLKRQLAPIFTTIKTLATLADTDQPPQPLPIARQDEIGELIGGFNHLLETLEKREELLKVSEERFKQLAEVFPETIFEADVQGNVTYANQHGLECFGYNEEDVSTGFNIFNLVAPDDRTRVKLRIQEKMQGIDTGYLEYQALRKDGSMFYGMGFSSPMMLNGMPVGLRGFVLDVTKRKEAEAMLETTRQNYETFFNKIDDLLFVLDEQGNIIHTNTTVIDRLGYTKEELFGKSILMIHPQERRNEAGRIVGEMLSGIAEVCPIPIITKSGVQIPVETRVSHGVWDGRSVIFGVTKDISKIKESEEKFSKLFYMNPSACGLSDLETHKYIEVNEAFCTLLEFDQDEVIGNTSVDLGIFTTETRESILLKADSNGKIINAEAALRAKNGGIKHVLLSAENIGVQNKKYRFTVVQDITDRKQAEDVLRESRWRLEGIIEGTHVGTWEWNVQTGETVFNETWAQIIGYTLNELAPISIKTWETFCHPDDLKQSEELLERHFAGGLPYYNYECRMKHKDGHWVWVYDRGKVVTWTADGRPLMMFGTHTDITERVQFEEDRCELEARLVRSEKMESLGTLAGGVAHDLNNVLGIVVGYSELLLHKIEESSPVRPYATNIMGASERAAAIIQDMLTLARRGVQDRVVVNLNAIVTDFLRMPEFSRIAAFNPDVKIKTNLESEVLPLMGSLSQLGKTITNLVSNAAEAMPQGGVLTITTSMNYLDRPVHGYEEVREGDYIVLSVSDTGEGIPAKDIKQIFEPFYTKKSMGKSGTGLGLAVVWGTVKDHNGYIDVQSEEGKGSTFTLYFPVTREETKTEEMEVPLSEYMGHGETILVVDDVEGQREVAAEMLRGLNYKVTVASSGEEAVAHLKDHKVDLIVLDMIMDPGMDGLDTYRSIIKIHPKQKAIIVSGFSETDRVRTTQTLGAGAYLKKPYIKGNLGIAVRKELGRTT